MSSPLRIVVTGLAATYPFGGVFWDYIQYVLGLHRLGHDVLYVEDTGRWCYSPRQQTFVESGADNAAHLNAQLQRLDPDLADRWFYRDAADGCYGQPWRQVQSFCRSADVFLHISASCVMREEYLAAQRRVFLDSDPMYTQESLPEYEAGTASPEVAARVATLMDNHDVFFSFGLNIGREDCRIPTGAVKWHPTRQPIVLGCFEPVPLADRRRVLTTVASWEPREDGPTIDGVSYQGKSVEFLNMLDLPRRSALPLELALSGPAPVRQLEGHGWWVRPAPEISGDPWTYRDYLGRSFGEWSVAKNAYVAGRTGWFATRTACYLAMGVPAIVQQTGFSHTVATGEGVLTFETIEEAAAAIEAVQREPGRHAEAARRIACEHFDASLVLNEMLEIIMGTAPARVS